MTDLTETLGRLVKRSGEATSQIVILILPILQYDNAI